MTTLLEAKDITKTFGHGKNAVERSRTSAFGLEENEVVTIVGESGSGKSTVARMVLGLLPITSGIMTFRGNDVTHIKGRERTAYWREVQAVFQDPFSSSISSSPYGSCSTGRCGCSDGRRSVRTGWRSHSVTSGCALETSSTAHPHQLSGGQRQRIMIARALMLRPKMLVADEATSMLDASLRVNILNVLHDLRDEVGLTVLFITHDIGQACYLADRVLVMEHGLMVEQGKTDEVIFEPSARVHPAAAERRAALARGRRRRRLSYSRNCRNLCWTDKRLARSIGASTRTRVSG